MLFHLKPDTECELTSFVGRTQKSGKDDVPAVSFRLKLASVPNELLDLFSATMRHTVYAPIEGQEQLPGVEITTPILRSKDLKHWAPETCLEGWSLIVARGITDEDALQMGSCKVDDFRFDFFEGGHMDVDFRVGTSDIDEDGAGMLWGRQKRRVFVTVMAPELPEAKPTAIDGTPEAFAADHPEAGDLFADRHAGDPDDADSEGGETDVDGDAEFEARFAAGEGFIADLAVAQGEQPAEPERGEAWPFPGGGKRTARGRAKTAAALAEGAGE